MKTPRQEQSRRGFRFLPATGDHQFRRAPFRAVGKRNARATQDECRQAEVCRTGVERMAEAEQP